MKRHKKRNASYRERKAFTLIEMLMVISIITILATMLLPALQKVKDTSRQVLCTGNLKNIALAMSCYTQDYNDYLPGEGQSYQWFYWGPSSVLPFWKQLAPDYINSKNVWACSKIQGKVDATNSYHYYTSYTENHHLGSSGGYDGIRLRIYKLSNFQKPSQQSAIGDWGLGIYSPAHSVYDNVLFLDQHAIKWKKEGSYWWANKLNE